MSRGIRWFVFVVVACMCANTVHAEIRYLEIAPENSMKPIGLLWSDVEEFNPSLRKTHDFAFATDNDTQVSLVIKSADGDVIRRLLDEKPYQSGRYAVTWDGKDDQGVVVPDEAWTPVFEATYANEDVVIDDPTRYSGGEIIADLAWTIRGRTELSFNVPYASRVLVRSGVDEGPMMRAIRRWEPVASGKVVVRWDGYDADQVEYFADRDDRWFVVMAYQLPQFTIISTGNNKRDYRQYRVHKKLPEPEVNLTAIQLQRNGQRLSRDFFLPRSFEPRVSIEFVEQQTTSVSGLPQVSGEAIFKINVPVEDRWVLDSSFYETGFYVNYEFQSEEEQGFVPMIWQYDASNLPIGRHIATVQLFGFGGFISSATIAFEIVQANGSTD
ncbi:FlgD immunoglobulin-like domain containing protein [Granulosicoccus antarcticus]|uniref:FlgD/Vpr Ig-like domain-containing protein n=1 Tax=Granulosicoccus antarcticus IMCC3135 TaxID=1192854 RepID=A0A2Z2P1Y8_9GAMM|nr:FlgD immunoglobulin-like domain containing protein [Granulosicoccus antarcticus]ASJ76268.1 hypothetical protein IMCC3135_31095 [Granulosicoccus antarcticus IMCC3135]